MSMIYLLGAVQSLFLLVFKANGDPGFFSTKPVVSEYLSITFYLLNIFLNPVYVVIVLFKIADHQQRIMMYFSYVEKIKKSFFNYVNEHRVNSVKQMLLDESFYKFSLLGMAE